MGNTNLELPGTPVSVGGHGGGNSALRAAASDRSQTMAECRGIAPLARGHALFSKQARLAWPVDIPKWSAWGDLHSQGCSGLSRTGLLFPVNHTPVGAPGLAPGRLSDLKSLGSAVPSEARRREIGGHEGTCTPKAARF